MPPPLNLDQTQEMYYKSFKAGPTTGLRRSGTQVSGIQLWIECWGKEGSFSEAVLSVSSSPYPLIFRESDLHVDFIVEDSRGLEEQ